jgi:hypothetical protein
MEWRRSYKKWNSFQELNKDLVDQLNQTKSEKI